MENEAQEAIVAPLTGTVVEIKVVEGESVGPNTEIAILESMKMEHAISTTCSGRISKILHHVGDLVSMGSVLFILEDLGTTEIKQSLQVPEELDAVRPDLQETLDRHRLTRDEARADQVAKRHARGKRTARENVADLCDEGSFLEYGPLMVAAQRSRRSPDDLAKNTPADGLVAGLGTVNRETFGDRGTSCVILAYDYTVLAGTQGYNNHKKKDRLLEIAAEIKTPVIIYAEGGGGRPGDTDIPQVGSLDTRAFRLLAELSGKVPLIGIAGGYTFAGNAALFGMCDVTIATRDANIAMSGPAMVDGGGLGQYTADQLGPAEMQYRNGVVDILVENEEEATSVAKRYLSYFQGTKSAYSVADQRVLRRLVPEDRLRAYDISKVIETLSDENDALELRGGFGVGILTYLIRIDGQPMGLMANNPHHLGGAIDSDAAEKAARFLELCDAFGLPLVSLCDTPGIMVGPEAEETAIVRHSARIFVTAASITVPLMTVVLRKAYGLGAMAMAGGGFKSTLFALSWPTGEFGAMGLEGAVKLGFRRELEEIDDQDDRDTVFEEMVSKMYQRGKALSASTYFEFDDVIDPAETRTWISSAVRSYTAGRCTPSANSRP